MSAPIGMYAHHQGAGHLNRCRAIARHLPGEVTIFSSRDGADVPLPLDVTRREGVDAQPEGDVTAGGVAHWAPFGTPGLHQRMAIIAEWVRNHRPAVFYVDTSVEVALFVRLMGIPVVSVAMPGSRKDMPHDLLYRAASALIACWPEEARAEVAALSPELARAADKLYPVGGISVFEGIDEGTVGTATLSIDRQGVAGKKAVVLQGKGGTNCGPEYWDDVARMCTGWSFEILGGDQRVANPIPYLRRADLAISAAGQNSIADIALANVPALVMPQQRPFGEQHATADIVDRLGLATVLRELPAAEEWPRLIERAAEQLSLIHI